MIIKEYQNHMNVRNVSFSSYKYFLFTIEFGKSTLLKKLLKMISFRGNACLARLSKISGILSQ